MRFVLFVLSVVAAMTVLNTPTKAQNYPWCAEYGGTPDGPTKLRLCNLSAVPGHYQRNWRILRPK
jgi:hypothetical protein